MPGKGGDRQKRILEYIVQHNREKGYSPTCEEIGEAVGLRSRSTVHGHPERLERAKKIRRVGIRRIEVVGEPVGSIEVIKTKNEVPTVIIWQGRRYVFDPVG